MNISIFIHSESDTDSPASVQSETVLGKRKMDIGLCKANKASKSQTKGNDYELINY